MPSALLWAYSAEKYFYRAIPESLRTFRDCIFTGGGITPPVAYGDSPLWDGAFGIAVKFPAKPQSLRACPLPLGCESIVEKEKTNGDNREIMNV